MGYPTHWRKMCCVFHPERKWQDKKSCAQTEATDNTSAIDYVLCWHHFLRSLCGGVFHFLQEIHVIVPLAFPAPIFDTQKLSNAMSVCYESPCCQAPVSYALSEHFVICGRLLQSYLQWLPCSRFQTEGRCAVLEYRVFVDRIRQLFASILMITVGIHSEGVLALGLGKTGPLLRLSWAREIGNHATGWIVLTFPSVRDGKWQDLCQIVLETISSEK